jgi:uncharacterized protein (TIGR02271 family)
MDDTPPRPGEEAVLPLLEERLRIRKRVRETGRVRVSVTTEESARRVEETLLRRAVEVERVPVGRAVAEAPPVREEGDTLVIPVVEEVLVVERRLVLREEVRVRLATERHQEVREVPLRRQDVAITRLPPAAEPPAEETSPAMADHTITALFDSRPEAERAVEHLVQQMGLDRDRITVHAAGADNATAGTHERRSEDHHGFLASLRDLFMPDEDRATYAEGLRRGGIMVSAEVPEERLRDVAAALEDAGAVDLDAREAEWRASGWTGGMAAGTATGATATAGTAASVGPSSDGNLTGVAAERGAATGAASYGATGAAATGTAAAAAARTGDTEAIPIVQEQIRIGKRVAQAGRVRVRSYVVETPVQEQVTLREERVQVERRPVDRPVTDADAAAFRDRTIEATETAEEAVVAKEARVVEEVVVRKTADERTETVSDTVRRTEVEVEDDRTAAARGTTTGGTTGTTARTDRNPRR